MTQRNRNVSKIETSEKIAKNQNNYAFSCTTTPKIMTTDSSEVSLQTQTVTFHAMPAIPKLHPESREQ